jgi:hypothetical protein
MGKTFRRDDFRRPKKVKGNYKSGKKIKEYKDDFYNKKKKINPHIDLEEIEDEL